MTRLRILALLFAMALILPPASASAAESGNEFHLTGILSSKSGQSALINGRILQTGDRVDGAEVLAIHDSFVVAAYRGQDFVLRVKPHAETLQKDPLATRVSPPSAKHSTSRIVVNHEAKPRQVSRRTNVDRTFHRVVRGETLFEIAETYFENDDRHQKQAMLWLYEANRPSFGSSMNVLYEGALLTVPDLDQLQLISASVARAEVKRHIELWERKRVSPPDMPEIASANQPSSETTVYGPVTRGETLSTIAARERPEGSSLSQMMSAVFDANPNAFGGHVDLLFEGALLRIPKPDVYPHQGPVFEMASNGPSGSASEVAILLGENVR